MASAEARLFLPLKLQEGQLNLKAVIPCVVVFVNDPPSAERRIDFGVYFIVLWSYGRKICLDMSHGNSENSYF